MLADSRAHQRVPTRCFVVLLLLAALVGLGPALPGQGSGGLALSVQAQTSPGGTWSPPLGLEPVM